MFYGGDEDDMDFASAGGGKSKLASLFDMDRASSQGGNESLTYTAPKEPKRRPDSGGQSSSSSSSSSSGPASAVLCAGVVFAYKFKDKEYASEGKLGVAVIGNHTNADYKLLLYITKEKPVSFTRITPSFVFTVQPNNYVSFYDDNRQSWSLMFESDVVLQRFAKQVALAKFLSSPPPKTDVLVIQDLNADEGPGLEIGDSVEIKYRSWQIEDNAIAAAELETVQGVRFRVGKQKAIRAWDDGVVGMKKNNLRLLICTPSMAKGGETKPGKISSSTPIVFEVEIMRAKFSKERSDLLGTESSVPSSSASGPVPPVVADDKEDDRDDNVQLKPKSNSGQAVQQSDKARLISRMAKMGQPMLPVTVATHTGASESESPSPNPSRPEVPLKPGHHGAAIHLGGSNPYPGPSHVHILPPETVVIPPAMPYPSPGLAAGVPTMMPASTNQLSLYHSQVALPYQAMMGGYQPQPPMVTANQPYGNMYQSPMYPAPPNQPPVPPVSQPANDANIPMMLMETRNQNTEVRVSLSRVSDKIDRISEKLDQLNTRQSNALSLSSSMPMMEVGMLVYNIERIVADNERLKKENMEKSSRVEEQNVKINELLQRNQLYVEQSNAFLEQRSDSYKTTATQSHARIQAVEQEKVKLAMELSTTLSQLASCQLEVAAFRKREGELKQQLDRFVTSDVQGREEVGSMRIRLADQDQKLEQLGIHLKEEQQNRKLLQKQVETLTETLNDVTAERESLDKNLNDKKKKSAEEIAKLESELRELQAKHEAELESLRSRLKTERNSTESVTTQKLTDIEDDLNRKWKEKCDRLLSSAQEKHERDISEVVNEKSWLQEKVQNLETKMAEFKSLRSSLEQEKDSLLEDLDQSRVWKDKYENLRTQATTMKERFEQRLKDLEEERNAAEEERERAEQERDKVNERSRRLQAQLFSQPSGGTPGPANTRDDVVAEVKKIMNTVYRRLRQEFEPEGSYSGSDIHAIVLSNVKAITLEMMKKEAESNDAVGKAGNLLEKNSQESRVEDLGPPAKAVDLPLHSGNTNVVESLSTSAVVSDVENAKTGLEEVEEETTPNEPLEQRHESGTALEVKVEVQVVDSPSGDFVEKHTVDDGDDDDEFSGTTPDEAKSLSGIDAAPVELGVDGRNVSDNNSSQNSENFQPDENFPENPATEEPVTAEEKMPGAGEDSSPPGKIQDIVTSVDAGANPDGSNPLQSTIPAEEDDSNISKPDATKDAPLFGDDDDNTEEVGSVTKIVRKSPQMNSKLFGDDDDDDGLFSLAANPTKKLSAPGTKQRRTESDDDLDQKPPPLPLFGESDDEKDLDWLS